eukprot:gene117-141_t
MSTPLAHDAIIQDSWRRCRAYGLDHQSTPSFDQLPADGVSQLLESQHSLVQTTHQEVLPYYENILSNSNCLIMLADNQGQVLTSWGTQRFIDPKLARGFSAGASWMERSSGTNAIGTALACAQAVHIEHDEHFLKANRFMTGSAAPIFDAQREIIAVLDVSSDSYLPPSHTLGMVKMMSQTVENRLILNLFRGEHFQLTFNTGLNNLDSQWAGLLIFDESGQVLSANRRADNLLGISLSRVLIDSLFKVSLLELLNQPEGLPFSLQAAGRNRFQCLLKRPKQAPVQARVFVETKKPREPGPTAISLKTLHFGDARVEKAVRQAERLLEKDIPSELYPVDLRIISATNRSLREQVQLGRFREDLYYRIGGLTLELPPLRERTDKQALFKQLWQQHREPTQWAGLTNEVLALFEQHPWPGNLRQVSSVLQVALAMAEEQPIRAEHLPDDFFVDLNGVVPVCDAVDDSLDLNERLKAVGGNISHLARELGVSRNTLYKRLRQNGNAV